MRDKSLVPLVLLSVVVLIAASTLIKSTPAEAQSTECNWGQHLEVKWYQDSGNARVTIYTVFFNRPTSNIAVYTSSRFNGPGWKSRVFPGSRENDPYKYTGFFVNRAQGIRNVSYQCV